jgi:16S rRNA (uracil1498-N3)-methyltransferase
MPHFFLPETALQGDTFHLEGPEAFHILKVLRCKEGDKLTFFDGDGGRFEGTIKSIAGGAVTGPLTRLESAPVRKTTLTLYQGLLKGSHWEFVLEKGTELGVFAFVPLATPRTVVLIRQEKADAKLDRWKKIILAAAKQSGNARLPDVRAPQPYHEAIKEAAAKGPVLLAWEGLKGATSADALREALSKEAAHVSLFIGPEGGFSDEEVEIAQTLGATVFGLGRNVLRGETAAIAATALVLRELGQI